MTGELRPEFLADRIVRHAARRPQAPALLWYDRTVSHGELAALARTVCERLDRHLPPGVPVAMTAKKSPESIAVVLGCLLARRPVLLPAAESGGRTTADLLAATGAVRLPDPAVLTGDGPWDRDPAAPAGPAADGGHRAGIPADTAFLLTTSGSTGTPKIVPVGHRAVRRFAAWAGPAFGLGRHTTVLSHAPLNFDLCLLDVWTTLGTGGCVALVDQDRAAQPAHLLAVLRSAPVHLIQGVPLLYRLLADGASTADAPALASVRHVLITGDTLPADAFPPLPGLFPRARFHNVYGCTETNDSFVHEIDPADPMPYGTLPIGRPVPGTQACLVDETGTPFTGPGTGELVVRTPFQTLGYADPAKDEGVFVAAPGGHAADGDGPGGHAPDGHGRTGRWYRTGDLVRRHPDDTLTLVGRRDHQVKVRGVRVNTAEVEAVLRAHPDVREAVVLALDDPRAGKRLHAVVQRRTRDAPGQLALRSHLAALLPRVALPAALDLTDLPLPCTSTGKPDRTALRQRLTTHHPTPGQPRPLTDGA